MLDTISQISFYKVARAMLMLFLVTFPFQIRSLIYSEPVFLSGNFNNYTSFFVYFADLPLLGAFLMWGCAHFYGERDDEEINMGYLPLTVLLVLFLVLITISIYFAETKVIGLFISFRFIELFLLYLMIVNGVLSRAEILKYFLIGVVGQSLIAVGQYFKQTSLGLYFLGESHISSVIPGVAKIDFNGAKIVRAYGTFPHPNVLAGVLLVALFWANYYLKKHLWILLAVMIILLMALLLTFSRTVFLALGGALLVYYSMLNRRLPIKMVMLFCSILVFLIVALNLEEIVVERFLMWNDPVSTEDRLEYIDVSKDMLIERPFGVGLAGFTRMMQEYSVQKILPWEMQPVHNVYLLIMNESGVFAGLLFIFTIGFVFLMLVISLRKLKEDENQFALVMAAVLSAMMIVFLFDHYFYTLYQGQVMLFIYFALASSLLNSSLLPRKKS